MKWLQEETYFMDSLCKPMALDDFLLPEVKTCIKICDFIRKI